MTKNQQKTQSCICGKQGCWYEKEQQIPEYCQANKFFDEIENSKREYQKPGNKNIYEAACIIGEERDGFRSRIEEALHFSKHLKLTKVGFAACTAFDSEMVILKKLFSQEGLQVVCASCQIGSVTAEEREIPELSDYVNATCNPIAQAEILNREQTELNFIVGLCLGHDILFTRYSTAPVSTLIVKDRMTGNNPAAALYGYHARRSLFKLPRTGKKRV
ncbi:MAG: DUF1847 domain-containing protein [Desulfobacterales bacterium]|nr:DUF1847 domain-containing protein [Desulfobacterales bacterium]